MTFCFSGINAQGYNGLIVQSVRVEFLKKLPNCFLEWLWHFHSHQQCVSNLHSLYSHQHLVLSLFLTLMADRHIVISVVFVFISLTANNVEHLFMCFFFLTICSPFLKCLLMSFVQFLADYSWYYFWVLRVLYVFSFFKIWGFYWISGLQKFSLNKQLFLLIFLIGSFTELKFLILVRSNLPALLLHGLCFCGAYAPVLLLRSCPSLCNPMNL